MCNNFRMLKFHMGKFSYNNGCSKFERAKRDFRLNIFLCVILERSRACMHAMEEFGRDCCIRGYHIYKETWRAAIGEELECDREPGNSCDRYAIAVKRSGVVIGHLPRKVSRVCSLFLRRGGVISCTVTGGRRYSGDLAQGGLEIPCFLLFKHKPKELQKLKKLLCKAS